MHFVHIIHIALHTLYTLYTMHAVCTLLTTYTVYTVNNMVHDVCMYTVCTLCTMYTLHATCTMNTSCTMHKLALTQETLPNSFQRQSSQMLQNIFEDLDSIMVPVFRGGGGTPPGPKRNAKQHYGGRGRLKTPVMKVSEIN